MAFCFNERLRQALKDRKISQEKFAELLDIKRQTVGQYISGATSPNAGILYKMAEILNVSADYLLGKDAELPEYMQAKIAEEYTGLSYENIETLHFIQKNKAAIMENEKGPQTVDKFYKIQLRNAIIAALYELTEGGAE